MNRQRGVGFGRHAKARVSVAEDSAGDRRPRGGRDAEDPSGIRRPGSVTSAQGRGGAGNAAHPRGLSPAVRRSRAAPGTRARVSHTCRATRSLPEHVRRSFRCGRPARPTCPWAEAGAARRRLERLSGPRARGFRGAAARVRGRLGSAVAPPCLRPDSRSVT